MLRGFTLITFGKFIACTSLLDLLIVLRLLLFFLFSIFVQIGLNRKFFTRVFVPSTSFSSLVLELFASSDSFGFLEGSPEVKLAEKPGYLD